MVLQFIDAAGSTDDAGTLTASATALLGLYANGALVARTGKDRLVIGTFLLRCLRHDDPTVHAAVLGLMGHLRSDGRLEEILSPDVATAIRARLDQLAPQEASQSYDYLTDLRDFWRP